MFDYLQKFNSLPANLRESVSSPAAMAVISDLENKYKIDLASVVMKVMVKVIPLADLSIHFVSDHSLDQENAKKLTADLKERLFFPVANYLGYNASYSSVIPKTTPTQSRPVSPATPANSESSLVDKIAKESGVTFAGLDLNYRYKNILNTFLKGVRSRVDTRLTLNKEVISGGLGLDHKVIDKIFNLCDEAQASHTLPSGEAKSLPAPKSGLEKIRNLYEKDNGARDIPYDLQAAIKNGEVKKPIAPLNLPVPEEAKEKLLMDHEVKASEVKLPVVPVPDVSHIPAIPITAKMPVDPISPKTPIIPTPPVSPVIPKAPAAPESKNLDAIKPAPVAPAPAPKIVRPPEKKPGLFSKLFGSKKPVAPVVPASKTPEVPVPPVKPINTPSIPNPSIAALRNEAAAIQAKPIIKAEPVSQPATGAVKAAPKVMGPLEELRYLDVVNFRRFGTSPAEAAAKVESKIKLLEKDGYDKMISGVGAWRESPVNSLYLKMGQEALDKGVAFKQYADDCKESGGCLLWEEIEAIISLNSRLMI